RGRLEHLRVLLCLADAHVERDLVQGRHRHRAGVAEAVGELGPHLLLVALAQARRRRGLLLLFGGGFHQSSSLPVRAATRLRLPLDRSSRTRVGLLSSGSSSITLETWIGPSFSMMPPTSPPFWVSLTDRGRWWRLIMLRPSMKTKPRFGSVRITFP